ncbi:UDP-glucose 4-epimerase GalE [Afipia birgiae]|jgi:UDP-glucose-4-epimerase GalE|uniref:UDP-glucose 4-epimerase GalE n=1 Tax=Afipia birgiae TaxID=151414 RepID=UPI0003060378|nr:UDP-glucose 4-epimerase GalE [Afipia birgiae]
MADRGAVLVTGGAGYIGSHCCKALAEAGYLPVCLDNFSTGHRRFVKWGPMVTGDVRDPRQLEIVFGSYDFAAVMHFAASSSVGESVTDPQKYYANNIGGTLALLSAMRKAGSQRLVFSSTGAVYGNAGSDPIPESAPQLPVNPYGKSKLMIEEILSDYRQAYDLNSVCFRYFNASGADASGAIGECRDPETHLIPRAMMALQGEVPDFGIFGDDYDTPDGTAVRDYIHVTDLANAHVQAVNMLTEGHAGGVYNLGTSVGYSVSEILSAIFSEAGWTMPLVHHPRRPGDPSVLIADSSAARMHLGFNPAHSDLGTIIRTAWNWHTKGHAFEQLRGGRRSTVSAEQ